MPMHNGNYAAPVWVNGKAPNIGATELEAISETLRDTQVLSGSGAAGAQTAGRVGQLYRDTGSIPNVLYRCIGNDGGAYRWQRYGTLPVQSAADVYSASQTYEEGEYCVHDGELYRAISAITTPEAWNGDHWERAYLGDGLAGHKNDRENPHQVTAVAVGLGNVKNVRQYSRSNPPTKVGKTTLTAEGWTGSTSPYVQTFSVDGVDTTGGSVVDIQVTPEQAAELIGDGAKGVLGVENSGGTLTAISVGGKPETDMTVQCSVKETDNAFLRFVNSGSGSFSMETNNNQKNWDGVLEYKTSDNDWTVWNGGRIVSGDGGYIYMRGTGNTYISGSSSTTRRFGFGGQVYCIGNIEYLLDYQTVLNGGHPVMADRCFAYLFSTPSLLSAPELPATQMAPYCYDHMFNGCAYLAAAPTLPTMTAAADYCFSYMFAGCSSLTSSPAVRVDQMAQYCCQRMFYGCTGLVSAGAIITNATATSCFSEMYAACTSLTSVPPIPAAEMKNSCCATMFSGCTSLVTAPALPATTLRQGCYQNMFSGCTSLVNPPTLPATTVPSSAYRYMFSGCTSLVTAPALPATTIQNYGCVHMFDGCTSLVNPPSLPATSATACYTAMFSGCTSLATLSRIQATYLTSDIAKEMYLNCPLIKMSATQTGEYVNSYRLTHTGGGTGANYASNMFQGTGGTFTGTPNINVTYYTSNPVV